MAMAVAHRTWRGTSIVDGAEHVLARIYSQHEHNAGPKEKCNRCGRQKSDPLHR